MSVTAIRTDLPSSEAFVMNRFAIGIKQAPKARGKAEVTIPLPLGDEDGAVLACRSPIMRITAQMP